MDTPKDVHGCYDPVIVPLVTLEEYYDGAEGEAHLMSNDVQRSDDDVLAVLQSVRDRPEVADVRIAVMQCEPYSWPHSDRVVVVTRSSREAVLSWIPEDFQPDDCYEGALEGVTTEKITLPPGYRDIWLWYD